MSQYRLIIETDRSGLVLKQLMPSDAHTYYSLVDESREHLSQNDDQTSKKYLDEESVLISILNQVCSYRYRFGIWDKGVFVGMVGLVPKGEGVGETSGWTGKRFCRKGYASVAQRTLATYALKQLGFLSIVSETHPENEASQETLKKAGFQLVRRTEETYYFNFVFTG